MGTRAATPPRANFWLWALAGLGVALLGLVPLSLTFDGSAPAAPALLPVTERLAFLDFATTADTAWLVDPAAPAQRQRLFTLQHAPDYGVVPALAPDGRRFAFTSLPPATRDPSPDTPADLWVVDLSANAKPVLLDRGVDLLVKPVWAPVGGSVVVRRSAADGFHLLTVEIASHTEHDLVGASSDALFPVAFAPDGSKLYYVSVADGSSDLHTDDLATGQSLTIARLADGLTRDWALSPAGDRLSYLVMSVDGANVAARAAVLDLANGTIAPTGDANADAFAPTWSTDGTLALGELPANASGGHGVITQTAGTATQLAAPGAGFDVPLAPSAAGDRYAVRAFDGSSIAAPGRATLVVVGRDGSRQTIASGEVTFLGWTRP